MNDHRVRSELRCLMCSGSVFAVQNLRLIFVRARRSFYETQRLFFLVRKQLLVGNQQEPSVMLMFRRVASTKILFLTTPNSVHYSTSDCDNRSKRPLQSTLHPPDLTLSQYCTVRRYCTMYSVLLYEYDDVLYVL